MKNAFFSLAFIFLQTPLSAQTSWIRINQIGYLTDDVKVAVLVSKDSQLLVNGTGSNADYTTPKMTNYTSSETIYNSILTYEKTSKQGLNGFILLLHIGVGKERKDKMYARLDGLITELKKRGYNFNRF